MDIARDSGGLVADRSTPGRKAWARRTGLVFLLLLWTALAVAGGYFARLASADTRCGKAALHPMVMEPGGVAFVATAVAWAVPFVVLAIRHRRAVAVVTAVLVVCVGSVASWYVYAHPVSIC